MLLRDVRYALRAMRKNTGFTIVACLTLALTIGAVSTVLTVVNTLLFKPLPVLDPGRVVEVAASSDHGRDLDPVSYPDYVHLRDRTRTLAGLAAHYPTAPLFVTTGDLAREINGSVVSANYFPLLGIRPALGRFFHPDEDVVPLRDRVAVIGHDLWRTVFAGSPGVLDETLTINGETFAIIGVAPASFRGIRESPSQIYLPTMTLPIGYRWCDDALAADCTTLRMIGRLADGYTVEDARAELATLTPPHWAELDERERPTGIAVTEPRGTTDSQENRQLTQLLAVVAIALVLVCAANLAGLLIARGNARQRELAIRASLGAGTARLLRQLLTESVLLALAGGGLGILLSMGLTRIVNTLFYSADYAGRPLYFDFTLEPAVVGITTLVSVATGLALGLLPAIKTIRAGTAESLRQQTSSFASGSHTTRWLVGAQAAAATALVAVAGLLAASAGSLVDGLNFDSSRVALLRLRPRLVRYTPEQAQRFTREAIRRLEALPGVESVSAVGTGASLSGFRAEVSLPESASRGRGPHRVGYIEVSPRYFETLGIPFLLGRDFDDRDAAGTPPVTIVSEALARTFWPAGDAVGHTLMLGDEPHEVVGIVKDVPLQSRNEALRPYVYRSYWQNPRRIDARVQVRVAGDPAAFLPQLVREVHDVDPAVPIANTVTLAHNMGGRFRQLRMSATVVSYAGALVLLLSAVGLYGALAFAVSRRTREIGIRMAIGARPRSVLGAIVREGMIVVLVGAGIGVGMGLAASRLLQHTLYGAASVDGVFYAGAALVVAVAGLVATWLPARRAATVDPLIALRDE